ncbi:hypothetical protein R1flu_010074 [Riccia fluitans]|uniref:Phage protein n=1 Tax=Riccia fluitans TaxID=41844 RepID=A0ABD1Z6Z2_9MARC
MADFKILAEDTIVDGTETPTKGTADDEFEDSAKEIIVDDFKIPTDGIIVSEFEIPTKGITVVDFEVFTKRMIVGIKGNISEEILKVGGDDVVLADCLDIYSEFGGLQFQLVGVK